MQNSHNWINSNGNLNHLNGSSFKVWFPNGQLFFKEYCINGKLHNPKGPAYLYWYKNGQLSCKKYYINGKLHNEKGPAYRYWNDNYFKEYWLEGEEVDKSTFEKFQQSSLD